MAIFSAASIICLILIGGPCYAAVVVVYNLFFHPLREFPGPLLWRATRAASCYRLVTGTLPFDILALHRKYGDVVRIAPNELAFADARAWRDIMGHRIGGGAEFGKSPTFYKPVDDIDTDIVNAEREEHGYLRRQLSHGFSDRTMRDQQPLIMKYIDLLVQRLFENCGDGSMPINMAAWYNFTTFDIIGDLAFGDSFGCLEYSDYHPWVRTLFETARLSTIFQTVSHFPLLKNLVLAMIPKKAFENREAHQEFTREKLRKRMEAGNERPDLIEGLLKKKDEMGIDFGKLHANSTILIIGGSETTATLLSGVTHLLLRNPPTLEKLTQEVRLTFKREEEINFSSVSNLTYMLACLDEALRMYPPVPVGLPRVVPTGGATICDYFVPENTIVAVHQWAMYHNDKHFVAPFDYRPERWLRDPEFARDNRDAFQPFHLGARNCLGRNLAYVEMRTILARIVWNFDLKLAPDSQDWMERQKVYLLWEKGPLNVYLSPVRRD